MTDEELRALVRDAIARHLGGSTPPAGSAVGAPAPDPLWRSHPSFGRFLVARPADDDGNCLIEPSVRCNHCGFCQSFGH
jgi:hypothetical protein